jgi:hypothetical protein
MSARGRAGVFGALSQGLRDVTGQIQTGLAQKKAEDIRKEKEERDRPLKELQLKSAQQSVASGALELERQKSIDQDEADFQAILKQLESRPALQQKFQDEIQKGAEQLQEQNKQGNVEQPQVPFAPKEEPPERQAAISAQPQVLPGPNQAPVQGPTQLTQEGEQIGEQLEMSEAERRLQSINKFRGSRSPAIQNELKTLQGQVDRERQEKLALEKEQRDRDFRVSEREASQEFITGENQKKRDATVKKALQDKNFDLVKMEQALRKEIKADPVVKDFRVIDSKYNGMLTLWNDFVKKGSNDSRIALDQGIVTLYNKILDPGSVVRESEFARTESGQALIKRMQGLMPKLKQGGTGLEIGELREMVEAGEALRNAAEVEFNGAIDGYRTSVQDFGDLGIDLDRVLGESTRTEKPEIAEITGKTLKPGQPAPQNKGSFRFDNPDQGATRVGRFLVERE